MTCNPFQVSAPAASEEYPMDFNIISPVRSCTLRAQTVAEKEEWVRAIQEAVKAHLKRKETFSHAAYASAAAGNKSDSDSGERLGDRAPIWVPDKRVTMCQQCHSDFTFLVRRHHCRACGRVVCSACSGSEAPLKYRNYDASRVCETCYEDLVQGMYSRSNPSRKSEYTYSLHSQVSSRTR